MKSRKCVMFQSSWICLFGLIGLIGSHRAMGDEPILLTNRADRSLQVSHEVDRYTRYYDISVLQSPILEGSNVQWVEGEVLDFVHSGGQVVDFTSGRKLDISSLDWAQLYAIHWALKLNLRHPEVDIRISHRIHGTRIVSAAAEPNDVVRVSHSRSWTPDYGRVSRSVIQERYRLKGIQNGTAQWSPKELGILSDALTFLTPKEQRYLQGVSFVRDHRGRTQQAAIYKFRNSYRTTQHIEVYDRTFAGQEKGFVGPVASPKSKAHLVILHELAHLIANQIEVQLCDELNLLLNEHNRLVSEYNQRNSEILSDRIDVLAEKIRQLNHRLDRLGDGPIVESYAASRTSRRGPTQYSDQSTNEAFAESYAMFKLDPLALKRTDLGAYQWFQSGAYLEMLP